MALFRSRIAPLPEALDTAITDGRSEYAQVLAKLEEVKAELKETSTVRRVQNQLNKLKEEIADAEIKRSQQEEEFARERREIEHHVGLERQRTELEIEQARKQAQLDVREENLGAEKERFKEHMDFYKEQMDKHIDDVKLLLNQVMTRIPTVTVDRVIREGHALGEGNGD
jgi:chromosome segregation ATPase